MATVNFITRTKVRKGKLVPLYIRFRSGILINQVVKTPIYVTQEQWNKKKQILKSGFDIIGDIDNNSADIKRTEAVAGNNKNTAQQINNTLDELRSYIKTEYSKANGEIDNNWLKTTVNQYFNPDSNKKEKKSLFSFIGKFIENAKIRPSHKTGAVVSYKMRREYERTFYYIKEFARIHNHGKDIDFADITLDFYQDFIQYLQSEKTVTRKTGEVIKESGLAKNTIGKKIQTLKIFLNAATDEGVNPYNHYRSQRFIALKEESDHIHLSEDEIKRIYEINLEHNPKLERVRDLFIIGCYTGLRFSDWSQIKPENIETYDSDKLLKVKPSKTGNDIYIPLHPMVDKIIAKYNGKLPQVISNQKMNEYLKEIARIAKLDDTFQKTITKAGLTRTITYKKHQLIGTHTARRSFATNLYNAGVPSLTIMQITGHRTESSFLKYIKVTPREHALKLAAIWREDYPNIRRMA